MDVTTATHDPQKLLSDLRDHLARHDKAVGFLFGAGTSSSVRVSTGDPPKSQPLIPAVAELTSQCKDAAALLGSDFAAAWLAIEQQCNEKSLSPNVENVLSCLRFMLRAIGSTDRIAGLSMAEVQLLEKAIREKIASAVSPDLDNLPHELPHRGLARWISRTSRKSPVEIFTLNYDVLLEYSLEAERVPYFDGFAGSFRPYFFPESLRIPDCAPGAAWTRLWKLHGSVNWRRVNYGGRSRIVRGEVSREGELILPSLEKYDQSRQQPYSSFVERLGRFLEQEDALLIACGFSFADEHINNVVFSGLGSRPRTHLYALQFEEPGATGDLVDRAFGRPNIIVVGPESAVISGRRLPWRSEAPPKHLASLFEIEDGTDAEGSAIRRGVMRLPDFRLFAGFLESITS